MLQFWKKSGKKEKVDTKKQSTGSPSKLLKQLTEPVRSNGDGRSLVVQHFGVGSVGPLSGFSDEELSASVAGGVSHQRSQLSKTLSEVLSDKGALGYFIQYLDAQGAVTLVKFWLDVESFCAAASIKNLGFQAPVLPITREELELLDSMPKMSPQHSQRSLGTDCDSLLESPSHSIDSGDNFSGENRTTTNIREPVTYNSPSNPLFCKDPQLPLSSVATTNENKIGEYIQTVDCTMEFKEAKCDNEASNLVSETSSSNDLFSEHVRTGINREKYHVNESASTSQISENSAIFKNCISSEDLAKKSNELTTSRQSLSVKSSENSRSRSCSNLLQATIDDSVRIYRKYLALGTVHRVPISSAVRERVIAAICKVDGIVDSKTFSEAQDIVFHIMEVEHFNAFLRSDFHCKHQIDVLTSGRVSMADILYNETALFYFTEYMEQEGNRILVEFWLAAVNFQQHLMTKDGKYDATEAQNDAMILYDKYFSMQATCPLGFGDRVRSEVEQNICREEGPLPDCFQGPINMVQLILEKNFLASFLTSQLNMKYLTELVNTIQASPALLTRHRKTGSESSSDWSISVQNTLLASEDSLVNPIKILHSVNPGEMCIDSRQLNDPDALWKRRRHNGLNFGRINQMGRFETDVEPEPDRKEESRIARVVKKLVNMEEDKAKEEMAWQIAEMIVKDITSLTLGSGDSMES